VAFARHLAARTMLCKGPSAFGTSVVIARTGHKIDVATPGGRPISTARCPAVEPGTIRDDLFRRDFSINTLAFCPDGPRAFILIDWYGGQRRPRRGCIRVRTIVAFAMIHAHVSGHPSRAAFRILRIDTRCDCWGAPSTRWIELLSGARLWRELRLMLAGRIPRRLPEDSGMNWESCRTRCDLGISQIGWRG